jgi:hypothetical protein
MNWEGAFEQARKIGSQARLSITIVSNQTNGLVGYAHGTLYYRAKQENPENMVESTAEYFSTGQDNPLLELDVTPASMDKPQLHNTIPVKGTPSSPHTALTPISALAPLQHSFSDRQINLNTLHSSSDPAPLGPAQVMQPFYIGSSDITGITLSGINQPIAKITLHSWSDSTFMVRFIESQGVYVGTVVPIDGKPVEIVYLLSLNAIWQAPAGPH